MKRILLLAILSVVAACTATAAYLFVVRETRPVIACYDPDNNIRSRTRCILNPFRYYIAEEKAEEVLLKLKYGQTQILIPFFEHLEQDNMDHILENESKYRVKSWRIGEWTQNGDELNLMYWVKRENYDWEEEVRFYFSRNTSDWNLVSYSAIY